MPCYNSTVIDADIETVWSAFADFHDMSKFSNVIESCEPENGIAGTEPGAKRVLNGAFHETLISTDAAHHRLVYSIDDGPEAVSKDNVTGYVGEIELMPVSSDGSTFVKWTSHWDDSKGGVADFCNPIYQALLSDLKAHMS